MPGGYVIREANGQALVYLYSRDTEVEAMQAKVLKKDPHAGSDGDKLSKLHADARRVPDDLAPPRPSFALRVRREGRNVVMARRPFGEYRRARLSRPRRGVQKAR
jgi:hypothetical protein